MQIVKYMKTWQIANGSTCKRMLEYPQVNEANMMKGIHNDTGERVSRWVIILVSPTDYG